MNLYRKAVSTLDWGTNPAVVIGHKSPDGDSVMAAMAYASLMQSLGHHAVPYVAGKPNNETVFAAKAFGFDLPEILMDLSSISTEKDQPVRLILVDHSDYAQAVEGARQARLLQVIDHHGIGDIAESKLLYAKYMPVGSTCSIVYISYKELDVEISPEVAKILLAGILADTLNLTKVTCTDVDREVYRELIRILAEASQTDYQVQFCQVQEIYKGMSEAAKNFDGMTDKEIFDSDAKDFDMGGVKFRLGSLDWNDGATIDSFLDRMLVVMGEYAALAQYHMAFCRVGFKEQSYILYCGGQVDGEQKNLAEEVATEAFGTPLRKGVIFNETRLSRKLHVVPALMRVLA